MDATPFQNVNLSAHGKNCSDVLCVLPVCVNWKLRWLANSRNKPTQEKKRNRLTSDAHSDRDEKLQRSEICKETASITNFSSSEDRNDETLKHLLEELEDFEEDFQIGKDDLRYSLPSLPDPQHSDPLLSSDSVISWNQLLNHQLPCDLMQVRETRKTSAQQLSNNVEAPLHKKRAALEVLPEKSAAMYSDIDFPTLDLEKFIPMDQYVRPTYNKQEPLSNSAWKSPPGETPTQNRNPFSWWKMMAVGRFSLELWFHPIELLIRTDASLGISSKLAEASEQEPLQCSAALCSNRLQIA